MMLGLQHFSTTSLIMALSSIACMRQTQTILAVLPEPYHTTAASVSLVKEMESLYVPGLTLALFCAVFKRLHNLLLGDSDIGGSCQSADARCVTMHI